MSQQASVVDTTVRLNWEVNKEECDRCQFGDVMNSPRYAVNLGTEIMEWYIGMYPKGFKGKDIYEEECNPLKVVCFVNLLSQGTFTVEYCFSLKTSSGYFPEDDVETLYSGNPLHCRVFTGLDISPDDTTPTTFSITGEVLCFIEDFNAKFIDNKITLVATLKIAKEGDEYLEHQDMKEEFLNDVRSLSNLENFCDYTIICGEKRIKVPRILLAARSKVFKAKFEHDTKDKHEDVLYIEDSSPETVEALFDYMTTGYKPKNVDLIANELIHKAEYYGLELLVEACAASLTKNLTADNATQTLVIIDQYLPESEFRQEILDFIKEEGDEVLNSDHWDEFYLNHPDLVKEMLRSVCKKKKI